MKVKRIEYKVTYKDRDVNHINWREAKKMVANLPTNVLTIERITRWWIEDGTLVEEKVDIIITKKI